MLTVHDDIHIARVGDLVEVLGETNQRRSHGCYLSGQGVVTARSQCGRQRGAGQASDRLFTSEGRAPKAATPIRSGSRPPGREEALNVVITPAHPLAATPDRLGKLASCDEAI